MTSVVVPVEPTPEMIEAGEAASWDYDSEQAIRATWAAMLAARPEALITDNNAARPDPASAPGDGGREFSVSAIEQELRSRYPRAFDGTDPVRTSGVLIENARDWVLAWHLLAALRRPAPTVEEVARALVNARKPKPAAEGVDAFDVLKSWAVASSADIPPNTLGHRSHPDNFTRAAEELAQARKEAEAIHALWTGVRAVEAKENQSQ